MVTTMSPPDGRLAAALASARQRAGFSQEEVAVLVGQARPVVSTWESGVRRPNSQQLTTLATIYRAPIGELLGTEERPRPQFEQLVFRAAAERLEAAGKLEIQRFLGFLDAYGDFLDALEEAPGLTEPPLTVRDGFLSKEDVRRKAEEARAFLRLGSGAVGDLAARADLAGITVFHAPLGADLKTTVSGAFVRHATVGASILVNVETTPGRRRFTLAHELAHALFHGGDLYVDYFGRRESIERFADAFAAEFLVPVSSLRAAVEASGATRVRDPETVVHLQRLFDVSYQMMLVRLRAANLLSEGDAERLRAVRPVHLATQLGYATDREEWAQAADAWGLGRFPGRFLRLLRRALEDDRLTVGGAAQMTGLAQEDIEDFLADRPFESDGEFEYLSASA